MSTTYVPAYDMDNPYQWAEANGWVFDETLTLGLNKHGDGLNFKGFAGAFRNINDPDQVLYLPKDMVGDMHHAMVVSIQYAEYQQAHDTDMYFDKYDRFGVDRADNYRYRSCHTGRVGYYSDGGSKFWNTMAKIDTGVHVVSHAVSEINHIVNMFGGRHR